MRIKQLQFLVAPEDALQFVAPFIRMDQIGNLAASSADGVLYVRGTYRFGLIPVPVDLAVRVARLGPDFLDLLVTVNTSGGFAAMVHEIALGAIRQGNVAGISVVNSHLILHLGQLAPYLRARFTLNALAFTTAGVLVNVSNLVIDPAVTRPLRLRAT